MNARRFWSHVLPAVAAALLAGCATAPAPHARDETRGICPGCLHESGVIGVIATSTIPKFSVQLPMTREQAVNAWRQSLTYGSCDDENQSSLSERDHCLVQGTMGLGLAWIAAGGIAGQMIGNSTAVSPKRFRAANLTLHNAIAELNLQESVRRSVETQVAGKCQLPVRLVPKPFPPGQESEYAQMAGVMCATLAWLPHGQSAAQYLAAQGVDTVLEIQLVHPGLVGHGVVNPRLHVAVTGRARLLSVPEGEELASVPIRYRGPARRFTQWAADNARAFRTEIDRCAEELAAQCVSNVLAANTTAGQHACPCRNPLIARR